MKVPFNMTTPRMKLGEGEEVVHKEEGMRKKGIFGNRFGELYVTNQRVAFVKAIMKAGLISMAANKLGAKPILELDRSKVTTSIEKKKKLDVLVLSDGTTTERFLLQPEALAQVLAVIGPPASA